MRLLLLLQVFAGLDYHAEPADLWSCGIVLVALLAGGEGSLELLASYPTQATPLIITLSFLKLCHQCVSPMA